MLALPQANGNPCYAPEFHKHGQLPSVVILRTLVGVQFQKHGQDSKISFSSLTYFLSSTWGGTLIWGSQ